MGGVAIKRKADGLIYMGTADRKALFGDGLPAVFREKADAERRAKGLGGEKWGEQYQLVPAQPVC
jgi:hypothetical protein